MSRPRGDLSQRRESSACGRSPAAANSERVARSKSSKRSRSTIVRPTRPAVRIRRVTRSTSPTTTVSMSSSDRGLRPSARWEPIERRRRRACTGRGSRLFASAWRCRPEAEPSIATSEASASSATWPTFVIPRPRSLRAVTCPTPQSRSTGSGWRNASSPSGGTTSRPSGFATPLATFARNFVLATPTVIGRPTCSRTACFSFTAISAGLPAIRSIPRTSRNASSIDSPSTKRGGVLEHPIHGLARLRVGRHPRRDDDRVRAEAARPAPAHRRLDAVGLGLVARGEHDTPADDHGPSPEPRVVPLLDRCEERVDVRVQDRPLAEHERMFSLD